MRDSKFTCDCILVVYWDRYKVISWQSPFRVSTLFLFMVLWLIHNVLDHSWLLWGADTGCISMRGSRCVTHSFQPASMSITSSSLFDRIVYCLEGMETKMERACLPLTYLSLTLHRWKCWYATWDVSWWIPACKSTDQNKCARLAPEDLVRARSLPALLRSACVIRGLRPSTRILL